MLLKRAGEIEGEQALHEFEVTYQPFINKCMEIMKSRLIFLHSFLG